MKTVTTTDPRDGSSRPLDIQETSSEEVRQIVAAAAGAARDLRSAPRSWRAGLLRAVADEIDASRGELTVAAQSETGLTPARLDGELTRTAFQFRLFADAVDEGSFLEATIDRAAETPTGAGPDLRRILVPLGPVAVFGASNFPFAFSVPGGDTASALAAGNPVIAKAHPAHPVTSVRSFEAMQRALVHHGAPPEVLGLIFGQDAGASLVADPGVRAVAFTGSARTGRLLMDLISRRPVPIPFYGELSSINPVIVSPAAAAARGEQIAQGLFASVTGSAGQLCTKPGLAFIPRGADALVETLVAQVQAAGAQPMLSAGILSSFEETLSGLEGVAGVRTLVGSRRVSRVGTDVVPGLLEVDVEDFSAAVAEEAFGPSIVLVRYDDVSELVAAVRDIPGSLTSTLHIEQPDSMDLTELLPVLQSLAGRVVFNGYPTGVRVAWAQHHGGPWPATNSIHTSVGVTAMRRFLRPMAWQDAPQQLLPVELQDGPADLPRRIDGVLILPDPR
ncbi:MAG: aldehyde dehydrogenase (NADP(+)) [Pseudolysinimonas sp.]